MATENSDTNTPPISEWPRRPSLLSVVCPVFNEENCIEVFVRTLVEALRELEVPFEIIFVEDDSADRTFEILSYLHHDNPREIKVLSTSRRFGHQASLAAGLQHAAGEVVICMDSDLQHPPALIRTMLYHWASGYQLVYTRRRQQRGRGLLKEAMSRVFYSVIGFVSDVPLEPGTADFRLMDRVVVDALNRFQEQVLFFRGLVVWMGFRRTFIEYDAPERAGGASKYTWSRMFRLGMDALFSFSLLPLRVSYFIGSLSLLFALGYGAWVLAEFLSGRVDEAGYTSLVLLVTFLGGLNLVCLGITAEYIGRIHRQTQARPIYLLKQRLGFEAGAEHPISSPHPSVERHA